MSAFESPGESRVPGYKSSELFVWTVESWCFTVYYSPLSCREEWQSRASDVRSQRRSPPSAAASRCSVAAFASGVLPPAAEPAWLVSLVGEKGVLLRRFETTNTNPVWETEANALELEMWKSFSLVRHRECDFA